MNPIRLLTMTWTRPPNRKSVEIREVQRLSPDSLPRERGVAMDEERQHTRSAADTRAILSRTRTADGDRIHRLQVAGIGHKLDLNRAAVPQAILARRANVILHISAAKRASRIDIFEPCEDVGRRFPYDVHHDVQAAPMAHPEHQCFTTAFARRFENLVQKRNQRGGALEGITFGARIAPVQHLLE